MTNKTLHHCKGHDFPSGFYGSAIHECIEDENGEFWVDNGEYATQVNFCPFCGEEAPAIFRVMIIETT